VTPETSTNSEISFNENKDNCFAADTILVPSESVSESEHLYFEDKSSNSLSCPTVTSDQSDINNASKSIDNCSIVKIQEKTKDGVVEHPIQIQQWLQQILAETETEPIIHEIGQFSKIPNTRLYSEFPVET
jgi:hypothetical protein